MNTDIEETKLTIPLDVIKDMSIESFRAKVVSAVRNAAYDYLCTEKLKMSKIMYYYLFTSIRGWKHEIEQKTKLQVS